MEQFIAELKLLMEKHNVKVAKSDIFEGEYYFMTEDACVNMEDLVRETS